MKKSLLLIVFMTTYLLTVGFAFAITYSFYNITNNNQGDAIIGETQLLMDVTQVNNQVQFKFTNTGSNSSSITGIYFETTPLLLFLSLGGSTGIDFSEDANPPKLPGGKAFSFSSTHDFDSNPPTQPNGINPSEWLSILFNLVGINTFDDVIAQLDDESLRVGIHVQGIESGGSETFINNPNNPVPEPGTLVLLSSCLFGIAIFCKRRQATC